MDEVKKPSNKTMPMYLSPKQFREHIADWSDDTLRNKIKDEGLPAVDAGTGERARYLFPRDETLLWFKRRTVKAG